MRSEILTPAVANRSSACRGQVTEVIYHLKAATVRGHDIFPVKAAGWSSALAKATGNGSSGIIVVFDSITCSPKVVIDDRHRITDARTAVTDVTRHRGTSA